MYLGDRFFTASDILLVQSFDAVAAINDLCIFAYRLTCHHKEASRVVHFDLPFSATTFR